MDNINQQDHTLLPVLRLSRDAVCLVRGGKVVFANDAAAALFGRPAEGARLHELLPEIDTEPEGDCFVTAATVRGVVRTVTVARFGDALVLTVPREEQSRSSVPAAALSQLRSSAFLLRFSMDRLLSKEDREDPYAEMLYHGYYRLLHLIGELSDASALAQGDLPVRMQTLDLASLVRDLIGSVEYFVAGKGVRFECSVPEEFCPVRGDREKLQQLLLILVSNSLLHTEAGGSIVVGLQRSGRQYILSVDDSGKGISGGDLAYAFSLREDGGPEAAAGGAGMGLHIAYGLARLHGGTVVLQSTEGEGTRVRLTLPVDEKLSLRDAQSPPPQSPEQILTELAPVLPNEAYRAIYRD